MQKINSTISIEEAWDLTIRSQNIVDNFNQYVSLFNLEYTLIPSPYWAYWFARMIIKDHWPNGEVLINQDNYSKSRYNEILDLYKRLGILGWSTTDQTIVKPQKFSSSKPVRSNKSVKSRLRDIAELADDLDRENRKRRIELEDYSDT